MIEQTKDRIEEAVISTNGDQHICQWLNLVTEKVCVQLSNRIHQANMTLKVHLISISAQMNENYVHSQNSSYIG